VFGIVQGGAVKRLRVESAAALAAMDFPGYAVGGLAVGEPQAMMLEMIDTVEPHLPADKPRYLMGVGTPDDLLQSVARGIDMFDCVMPTRGGRHGMVFSRFGRINLRNARHADDSRPIDPQSTCAAARDYSRAYWHHLVKSGEILAMMALTAVNIAYYQELMAGMRQAIGQGRLADYAAEVRDGWARGDAAAH
jgi:queuine tRNA-ribosyltransferase